MTEVAKPLTGWFRIRDEITMGYTKHILPNGCFHSQIVIKAKHGQDTYTCCLQSVDHIWVFWNVFGRFTDNLRCCKNLFSSEKVQGVCPKCNDQGIVNSNVEFTYAKFLL